MRHWTFCVTLWCMSYSTTTIGAPKPTKKPYAPRQSVVVEKKIKDTTTTIEFDEVEKPTDARSEAAPIERILRNPVLSSGIASGADAINRSINSLMESLFYKLMDNEFRYPLTGSADVVLGLNRDVYVAENGAYVVVDRFGIGPDYGKEIYRYNDIPVKIGASQKTEVFDIYLRTDPMRVAENKNLPMWRTAINNWFGILPLLEWILPPAFNPNEMYDPLRRLESPFTFPLSVDSFAGMETGSIKSYAINGGINLGVEMAGGIHGYKDIITSGASGLEVSIPYTVFRTGQYRVNVLKKDINTAWIGIMDTNRIGHRVESRIGKTYYLLSKTVPLWRGMPAPVFPLDFGIEEAIADLFGRVYAFDLRNEEAKRAYLEAVHGNLAPAQLSWLRATEDKLKTGVTFFYNKKETRYETKISSGPNIFVVNKNTKRTHSDAEIEITDRDGKFYILEARQDQDHSKWDMLTGGANKNYSAIADLRVRKVVEQPTKQGEEKARYEFIADPNPIDVTLSLQIVDKYVETEDLNHYLSELTDFSQIDLNSELPPIPVRDDELKVMRRKRAAFASDLDSQHTLHVTPTHLGSFEAYASIRLKTSDVDEIARMPREHLWEAFCVAFNVSEGRCKQVQKSLWTRNVDRLAEWAVMPLKLFDVRFARPQAMTEIEDSIQALKRYVRATDPEEKRDQLRRLFATEHPLPLTQALLLLANLEEIPRTVQLGTKPKGNGPQSSKDMFGRMDGKRFRRGPKFPPPARYDSTLEVENHFNPANLSFVGVKPRVRKLSLYLENQGSKPTDDAEVPPLAVRVYGTRLEDTENVHIYVRLEQTGKVQLAKFKLTEEVIDVPVGQANYDFAAGTSNFLVRLAGPRSTIASLVSSEALALGGTFKLTVAVSTNTITWSDERSLEFRLEDGKLLPAN